VVSYFEYSLFEQAMTGDSALLTTSVVTRNGAVVETEIDGEVVALNIETGNCYGLNPVGSRVWNLMSAPIRISDICARLITEYQVQAQTCEEQVMVLLEQLRAEGLIARLSET
jgi:Coenzyme PQQ synthesis protein D (PqqD)